MTFPARRAGPLLSAAALFGLLALLAASASSQTPEVQGGPPLPPAPADGGGVTLPGDTRARQKLEAAREYVKARDWDEAVRALQGVLDAKEDQFLPKGRAGKGNTTVYSASLRAEVGRLLLRLPPKGQEAYDAAYAAKAKAALKEAVEKDDVQLLARVVQRYLPAAAGAEAAERLGTYHLDRGRRDLAARCFAALLDRPGADHLAPLALYKAALAFHLAGDSEREAAAWKALAARAPDGLTIDGRAFDLDGLRTALARLPAEAPPRGAWPLFRGGPERDSRGDGDLPLLEPLWTAGTVHTERGREWVEAALKAQQRAGRAALPGPYPIAVAGKIIYRSYGGLHVVEAATGRELHAVPSPLALDNRAGQSGRVVTFKNWLTYYGNDGYRFPVEQSIAGCLSSDGVRAYSVEGLPLPPPPDVIQTIQAGGPRLSGTLGDALFANRLRAVDLETGEIAWEKGGPGKGELQGGFFLGAPLPAGGKLYALFERDGETRLVGLDPASGSPLWAQRLGTAPAHVLLDPGRRLRGVQMTCAGGLLICPTGAGAVFAFDLFAHRLAWAHLYPSKWRPPQEGAGGFDPAAFNATWRESAPVVADGKVVFTAADSDEVHCVSLRDGAAVWQAGGFTGPRYLAGAFGGKALVVGTDHVRGLSLADGKEAWSRAVGAVAGQGAASGGVYYLPLKSSAETGGPGVLALDAAGGKAVGFARAHGGAVPGNLAFLDGQVVSQTATALAVYPQLKVRLARIDRLLAGDPRNPAGLTERGGLRLDRGDVAGALADLRAALAGSPAGGVAAQAQAKLHEALKLAVQRDFGAGEKYLAELQGSCRVPLPDGAAPQQRLLADAERQRREANVLLLLARGREAQGRLADALAAYAALYDRAAGVPGAWNGEDAGWLPSGKPAAPRPDLWVHGRVTALLDGAKPAQQTVIDKEVARQWEGRRGGDLDALGRFVALFGTTGTVGPEAKLEYAGRLAAHRDRFLEAELNLLSLQRQRQAPAVAARALEALARLLTERGQLDDALYYYRQLAADFPRTQVRDGKTGADVLKGLASDKRFLPLLDDPWAGRKYKTAEVDGLFLPRGQLIGMEPEGEAAPFFRRHRLAYDAGGGALKLLDRNSGAELWSHTVGIGNLRALLARTAPPLGWIPFRGEGHLAVVTLGHMAYGIDLLERRVLWTKDFGEKPAPFINGVTAYDNTQRLAATYADNVNQPLGRVAPIRPGAVCLTVRRKLVALDPLRGDLLWALPLEDDYADVFADDNYAVLIEGQTQGAPAIRRAVTLRGGRVKDVAPFAMPAGVTLQTFGRFCCARNPDGRSFGLFDPLTGRSAFTKPVPAGGHLARSEVPHLTATVAKDGSVRVWDLRSREELFTAKVDADYLRGVQEVRLCRDRLHYYLLLNRDVRARDNVLGPAFPNVAGGMRCLPANGVIYAFHRDGGKVAWAAPVKAQYLILEQFDESPLLLFSAVVQRPPNPKTGAAEAPAWTVTSIDKHTGKVVWAPKDYAPVGNSVYAVQINPATGTIDMVTRKRKLRHTAAE